MRRGWRGLRKGRKPAGSSPSSSLGSKGQLRERARQERETLHHGQEQERHALAAAHREQHPRVRGHMGNVIG